MRKSGIVSFYGFGRSYVGADPRAAGATRAPGRPF